MKKKWRHIRDHFFRVLNKGKSGDAAPTKKKKYLYADALSFLLNSETKRPTSGNITPSDDDDIDELQERDVLEEAEEMGQVAARQATEKIISETPLRKKKLTCFQSQLLNKLDKSSGIEEDVDRMYLLSMLPDYKGLTDSQKLDFKLMTLQFFRNVKAMPQSHTTPMVPPVSPQLTNLNMQRYNMLQSSGQCQPPNTAQPMNQQMQQGPTPLIMHQYDQVGRVQYTSPPSSSYVSPSQESMNSDFSC